MVSKLPPRSPSGKGREKKYEKVASAPPIEEQPKPEGEQPKLEEE